MDAENHPRQVLDLLQGMLASPPASPRPEELLKELARVFGAAGAGLALVRDDVPSVQLRVRITNVPATTTPWEAQSQLVTLLKSAANGVVDCVSIGDHFLVAACPRSNRLLWLEAPANRQWSRGEQASLVLAASTCDLLLPDDAGNPPEQLRYHQRLQDAAALSGRLAHAFDNILTGILGFAELTLSTTPSDSVTAQYVTEVLRAAQQGVQLTQQFHQFSRSSNVAGGSASVPLVLSELEKMLRATLEKSVTLELDVPPELPLAAISSENLHQVIGHLLDNAREAVGSAGVIRLSARRCELSREQCAPLLGNPAPGPFVEIAVADSGPGLTGEARQRLFVEPFFSNKPRHRGLGLAHVYRLLHAHKAGFAIEPRAGGGLVARLYLPLALVTSSMPGSRSLAAEIQALGVKRS